MPQNQNIRNIFKVKTPLIPVLKNKKLMKIIFINEIINTRKIFSNQKLKILMIIMAGGKGQRLNPFSEVLPNH